MNRTGEARGPIAIDPVEPIPIERKGPAAGSRLRIAQVAGPFEPVPPRGYGGTERVIDALVRELIDRGHEVTTYAAADSEVPGRLIATVPEALRHAGLDEDGSGYVLETAMRVLDDASQFDVIHSHLEWSSLFLSRATTTPTAFTFHGRLDRPWATGLLQRTRGSLVAISEHQASAHPDLDWAAIVHNGLDLTSSPWRREGGQDLCFVGRVAPEKGVIDAVEVAVRAGRHLRVALAREHGEAHGVAPDLVDEVAQRHVGAGALGHAHGLAAAHDVHDLAQHHFEPHAPIRSQRSATLV